MKRRVPPWNLKYTFIIAVVALISCASTFPFKYYGLDGVDYSVGHLRGAKSSDDLRFEICRPNLEGQERECVVFRIAEFDRLYTDYIEMANRLKDCEESRR